MSNRNDDSKTIYFSSVNETAQSENKSSNIKPKLMICIFSLIILILLAFVILIFGQIFTNLSNNNNDNINGTNDNYIVVPFDADQIHVGSLLIVSKDFKYNYNLNTEADLADVHAYWKNDSNNTFSLVTTEGILLSSKALEMFNKMLSDYCEVATPATNMNKTNITVAWGYSNEEILKDDVVNYSETFYDNATGNTLTLRQTDPNQAINENLLKSEYTWLYDNMHKYGFIIRYPNDKKATTGFDSKTRVHLRYVGYEHATYMKENNLCLEEYLAFLRTEHKYESEHLTFTTSDGKTHEVYYVKAEGNPVSVNVPKDTSYYVSGDNQSGFVVTVTK